MTYVALLRGINVGGKNRVEMALLKQTFENAGLKDVSTYINSGNIIFSENNGLANATIVEKLEKAIEAVFGFYVKVLVRDSENIKKIANVLPKSWQNDKTMKCDIMFLWEKYETPKTLQLLTIKPGVDNVKYTSGTLIWRVDRENINNSGIRKILGSDIYKNMTIRNCNTFRKIHELIKI